MGLSELIFMLKKKKDILVPVNKSTLSLYLSIMIIEKSLACA